MLTPIGADHGREGLPLAEYLETMAPGEAVELHEGGCPAGEEDGAGCECRPWLILRRDRRS
jgi:hypothetical protein